jgi:tRNA threonylcarbamoyladenosine biosynthesis protein TsaB
MANDPLILSIETATRGGSVCLSCGTSVLASLVSDPEVSHSNRLLANINEVLGAAGIPLDSIQLFAATAGPGSFTGLRIGLATIKALSVTLQRPCIGINTLHAIAHAGGPSKATVAALPAGRGELFAQLLSVASGGEVTELDAPAHLSPDKMLEKYGGSLTIRWAGEGPYVHRKTIKEFAAKRGIEFSEQPANAELHVAEAGWILARKEENLAQEVGALALKQFESGALQTAHCLQAIYVRPSDAELKA